MPAALFTELRPRKLRVAAMAVCSLLAHAILIAVVLSFAPVATVEVEPPDAVIDGSVGPAPITTQEPLSTLDEALPPLPKVVSNEPPAEAPLISEDPELAPPESTSVAVATNHPHRAVLIPGKIASASVGGPSGSPSLSAAVGRAGAGASSSWQTPHPPYPTGGLMRHLTGSTVVRITTDAAGNVASVAVVKSAGNLLLDDNTQRFVRLNWKGPPNTTRQTEFTYQLR